MNSPGDYAVETVGLSKHFGAVRAVDELSLSIPRRGITSIVGPNGSGKSTLVNVLSGVLPIDGGIVILSGTSLRTVNAHEVLDAGVTRTFQEVRLFDQISVWDNIMVVLTNRRLLGSLVERSKQHHRDQAERILRLVGMWDKRRSLAMDLSYGQRKLLEIGRALALDVQVYMFDEPFAGLFPQMIEPVKDLVRDLRDQGRTVIFISHNMDIVRELPDHLIVLESGRLLTEGEVHEVLSGADVIEAYLGD